jgi:4-amino-4-deoxy-L-arabinose transferase-like glycosyltransferase
MSTTWSRHPARWLTALLLLHLLLATAYSVTVPLGEAPDEADHWAYVVYLARERRLPEGPRVTQSKHPPLYHLGAAAFAGLADPRFDFLRANPDAAIAPGPTQSYNFFIHTALEAWPWSGGARAFHLARLWSVLLSTATVAAVYGLARVALPKRPAVALLATGLVATLPEFAFIGGALNNDNAAALLATLVLWGGFAIYRAGGHWRAGWWTPLALGLGLLAKVSTTSLWPVIGLLIVAGAAKGAAPHPTRLRDVAQSWRRWVGTGLIVFLPALLVAAPWLLRNWRLYGDPTGMALVVQTVDLRTTPWTWADTIWLLRGWFISFWGKFGGAGHIPFPAWVYWMVALLGLCSVVGLLRHLRRSEERAAVAWLGLALLAVVASMARYSLLALGTDQGRLLFPALGPIAILLAVGWAAWPWGRWGPRAGGALVVGMATLAIYGLVGVIRPAYAPPAPPTAAELATSAQAATPHSFGELTLVGWDLTDAAMPILYWHAAVPPTQDWRTRLRITAEDGSLVHEHRRSPGYGRFATDTWPAATTLRDAYTIPWPDWAGPGRYRVEVALYAYGNDPGDPVEIGWIERVAQ